MTRILKRLPTDKDVAKVEAKRAKIVKDVEATIPDIEQTLALATTAGTLQKARSGLDRMELIIPKNEKLAGMNLRYKANKNQFDIAEDQRAKQKIEQAAPKPPKTPTEGPDAF